MRTQSAVLVILVALLTCRRAVAHLEASNPPHPPPFALVDPNVSPPPTSPRSLRIAGMVLTLVSIGLAGLATATILSAELTGGETGASSRPGLLYTGIASGMTSAITGAVGIPLWCYGAAHEPRRSVALGPTSLRVNF